MTPKPVVAILFLAFCIPATRLLAAGATPTPEESSTPPFDAVPSILKGLPPQMQKAIATEIPRIDNETEKIEDLGEENTWTLQRGEAYQEDKARVVRDEKGRIRLFSAPIREEKGALKSFYYDQKGRLLYANFSSAGNEDKAGPYGDQRIYTDEKGKIFADFYMGISKDKDGQARWNIKLLKEPIPLPGGYKPELIWDSQKIPLEDALPPNIEEKSKKTGNHPYVGFSVGEPCWFNAIAGMDFLGPLGFDAEGMYYGPTDSDVHGELTLLFPTMRLPDGQKRNLGVGVLSGFGSGASSASTDRSYSGFAILLKSDQGRLELDCVQDGFCQFSGNNWRVFFRSALFVNLE